MGDQAFYDFTDDNISLESHSVNCVNDPAVIAHNMTALCPSIRRLGRLWELF